MKQSALLIWVLPPYLLGTGALGANEVPRQQSLPFNSQACPLSTVWANAPDHQGKPPSSHPPPPKWIERPSMKAYVGQPFLDLLEKRLVDHPELEVEFNYYQWGRVITLRGRVTKVVREGSQAFGFNCQSFTLQTADKESPWHIDPARVRQGTLVIYH